MGTITITIMAIRIIILGIILGISTFVSCMEIPEDILELERMAFGYCDSDKMVGLRWNEVKKCEEKFAEKIAEMKIKPPSLKDFENADLNGDGTLFFEMERVYGGPVKMMIPLRVKFHNHVMLKSIS